MVGKEATSAMSGNEMVWVKRDLQWGQGLQPWPQASLHISNILLWDVCGGLIDLSSMWQS